MSRRDHYLKLADKLRSLPAAVQASGAAGFDVRQVRVIVRSRTWSSGEINVGVPTVNDIELTPTPKVQGVAGDPIVTVGPITPAYTGGGYTPAQLNPEDAPGFEYYYVLIFPDGVERPYKLVLFTTPRPFRYMLQLESIGQQKPF